MKKPDYGIQLIFGLLLILLIVSILGWFLIFLWIYRGGNYLFPTISNFIIILLVLLEILVLYHIILILIRSTTWYRKKLSSFIVKQNRIPRNSKILDVHCGNCLHTVTLAKYFTDGEIWGIHPWKKNENNEYIPKKVIDNLQIEGVEDVVRLRNADTLKMPFSDNYFDMVCSDKFHNAFFNKREVLKEMVRVLKPEGVLIITWDQINYLTLKILDFHKIPLKIIQKKKYLQSHILIAKKI